MAVSPRSASTVSCSTSGGDVFYLGRYDAAMETSRCDQEGVLFGRVELGRVRDRDEAHSAALSEREEARDAFLPRDTAEIIKNDVVGPSDEFDTVPQDDPGAVPFDGIRHLRVWGAGDVR